MLVDVDVEHELPTQVKVERQGFALIADVEYKRFSDFCIYC